MKKRKKKPETFYQDLARKYICKKFGCVAVRELNFGGPKFDVVGFSPDNDEFYIVECKRTKRAVGVGQTFGQILAYKAMILDAGEKFLDAFNEKLVKEGIKKVRFWANSARFVEAGKIPVRFFVALLDEACRPEILQLIKKDLRGVGIIRINRYNQCRDYIKRSGIEDYELCESSRVEIPIAMPLRNDLKRVLQYTNSSPNVFVLAAKLDSKIRKMKPARTTAVLRGEYAIVYRTTKNFAELYPREEHLRVAIKGSKGWKQRNVEKPGQLSSLFPKIRKAIERSLG
jgi:hypothetical protein